MILTGTERWSTGSSTAGFTNRDFKWVIDEVKIYNRALSPEEILWQAKIAWF